MKYKNIFQTFLKNLNFIKKINILINLVRNLSLNYAVPEGRTISLDDLNLNGTDEAYTITFAMHLLHVHVANFCAFLSACRFYTMHVYCC